MVIRQTSLPTRNTNRVPKERGRTRERQTSNLAIGKSRLNGLGVLQFGRARHEAARALRATGHISALGLCGEAGNSHFRDFAPS
jgi:hypothetical protein